MENSVVQQQIAESRLGIDQGRLVCQHAAKVIDEAGNRAAASLVSLAKVAIPRIACEVINRTIQVRGGCRRQ